MAPTTPLPLASFLLHSTPSIPDSSKTHSKYLNSQTCSKQISCTWTSHSSRSSQFITITLLLPALTFSPILLHTSTNRPTITIRSSSKSPHRTKSSAYKRSGNLYSLPSSTNLTPLLPIPISPSFITVSIYTLNSKGDMIQPCLTPLCILNH